MLTIKFSFSTPVFTGDEGASGYVSAAAAAAAAGGDFDFGVDPNIDPELALALRVSMEEERARQEAAAKKAADEAGQKDKDGDTASASQETVARTTEKNAEPMVSCYSFCARCYVSILSVAFLQAEKLFII